MGLSLSLLDFNVTITDDGNSTFEFYKKPAKKPTFVHHKSAQPLKFKNNIIRNERNRISQRCTASSAKEKHNKEFDNILRLKGYSHDLIDSTKSTKSIPQVLQADPQPTDKTDWFYFKIPYVSDTVDYKLRKIFRQEGLPIRVAHKSSTLRQMLTPLKTNKACDRINCPMSHTGHCFTREVVYKIRCEKCHKCYIGSTIRHTHDRIKEHLSNANSSVLKHLLQCQTNCIDINVYIIARNNDPINIRLLEAHYIRTLKPEINSREECIELRDLLF